MWASCLSLFYYFWTQDDSHVLIEIEWKLVLIRRNIARTGFDIPPIDSIDKQRRQFGGSEKIDHKYFLIFLFSF